MNFLEKKLLIVLDDENEFKQLQYLYGNYEWVGQGSVIIITTRDVRLLNLLEVNYAFKMDDMNENESLELFSLHAFGEAKPRKELNELARNIVAYCGGLPLALEVLGSYLCGRTKEHWKSVFSKLKIIPNYEVLYHLQASFDLPPLHNCLANIPSILVQCDAEFQLSKQVKTILVEYGVNFTESRLSNRGLRFSFIGVGRYNEFFSTLRDSVSEVPSLALTFVSIPSPFIT